MRTVQGISAILLPYTGDEPDLDAFLEHLHRTHEAGLGCAVNMDTGFGPQLTPAWRRRIVELTSQELGAPFVAGAMPFGHDLDPIAAYRTEIEMITQSGGIPIIFPSEHLDDVGGVYAKLLDGIPRALGFELGPMFAPFGRIFDDETFKRLLDIEALVGAKHSSLSRTFEMRRLRMRDERRPEFRVYTGNDLAIDMIMWGSDYLLGLSTFDPDAFAQRDRWWAQRDVRFYMLNDALQALGAVAFRDPVPAYKDSAARYLDLTGRLPGARPHPGCPMRPEWEAQVLRPLAGQIQVAMDAPPAPELSIR